MGERVVILGGGIIGLSCAFECQRRGHDVTLLERWSCGGQASGAAAGMLAPYSENSEQPDDFFQLCLASLKLYPYWQEEIKRISKMPFEYTNSGSLHTVYHEADLLDLEGRILWQREFGTEAYIMHGDELFAKEPLLSRNILAALYCPEESHVFAPDYVKSLEQACRNIGVRICDHLEQVEIVEWQQHIVVKAKTGSTFTGDRLVICSGAWAQELERTFDLSIPVYPIRGQICAYETPVNTVRHMVFSSQGYVVAKANGTLVCGASEDIAGFDTSVTEKGIARLEKWNKQVFPFLSEQTPFHKWAGLRPATQDGFPLLGVLRRAEHVIFAAGHYRNGILLSPVTGMIVADLIDGRTERAPISAFAPERFS